MYGLRHINTKDGNVEKMIWGIVGYYCRYENPDLKAETTPIFDPPLHLFDIRGP